MLHLVSKNHKINTQLSCSPNKARALLLCCFTFALFFNFPTRGAEEKNSNIPDHSTKHFIQLTDLDNVEDANLKDKVLKIADLEDLIDLNHPSLRITELDKDLAVAEIQSATSAFIPRFGQRSLLENYRNIDQKRKEGFTFSGELSWQSPFAFEIIGGVRSTSLSALGDDGLTYGDSKALFDGTKKSKLTGFTDNELSIGLRLPLLRNLLIDSQRAKLKQAKLLTSNAEFSILKRRAELMTQAQKKYWDWVAAGLSKQVMQQMLDLAVVRLGGITDRVSLGANPPIDSVEAQSQINSRREALAKAHRDLEKETIALSIYLWINQLDFHTPNNANLPKAIPNPLKIEQNIINQHINLATTNRPELGLLETINQQENINLRLARNELLPKLDLEVLPTQNLSSFDNGTNIRGALVLDVPLYPLKAQSEILKTKTKLQKNLQTQKLIQGQINNEIKDAVSYLETSRERILHSQEAFNQLNQLSEAERTRFQYGGSNLFLLNQRESSAAQSELKVIEALAEHQKALVEYRYAIGEWSIPGFDRSWVSMLKANQ